MQTLEKAADNLRCQLVLVMGLDPSSQSLTFNPLILAVLSSVRAEALREAADMALAERLSDPQDNTDLVYNRAVRDCVTAIRTLASKQP